MKLQSLVYISTGNLPSKAAHSIQIAKMAQAFAQKIDQFELVTCGDILSALKGMDAEFQTWYGLTEPFKVVRLPLHLRVEYPFPNDYEGRGFPKLALLYACLKSPSLVYTRSPMVVYLSLEAGLPILWEWHEMIDKNSPFQRFLRDKNLLGMVTTLPQIAESYLQQGLAADKILVAANAVDFSNFIPKQAQEVARHRLCLPLEKKIIVYSGHLYEYKGIPTILETAQRLPDCEWVLVGGCDSDIQTVQKNCGERGLNNVRVVGYVRQSELASYLYAADVLILPTSQYWQSAPATCPLKLFDYMAVEKPIVASALPTIMTVLRDRDNALLAEPDNPVAFEQAIVTLLEHPSLARAIAQQAYHDVRHLTWENRAEQVLQFAQKRREAMALPSGNRWGNLSRYIQRMSTFYRKG